MGVLATKSITSGTLLISDPPILTTACIKSIPTTETDLARTLRSLPKAKQRAFLSLHNNHPGEKNPLSNIVRTNGYPLGPNSEVGGVFQHISRINHSCLPNATHSWNAALETVTVYAARDIPEGQEIMVSYHAGGPSWMRKRILKEGFGFNCTCELCTLPVDKLKESDARLTRAQELDSAIGSSQSVRHTPGKVLQNCRTLAGIYEEEQIRDDRTSRLWFDAFQVCNMHGDKARASIFAGRYCKEKLRNSGEWSLDLKEMQPYMKNPEKHDSSSGMSKNWATELSDIPQGVDDEAFEKWLWKNAA